MSPDIDRLTRAVRANATDIDEIRRDLGSDVMTYVSPPALPGRALRARWPGYCYVRGKLYYDVDQVSGTMATVCDTHGTAIADNSGGDKLWLVLDVATGAATYEVGAPPYASGVQPDSQEWYYVPDTIEVPRIPAFG